MIVSICGFLVMFLFHSFIVLLWSYIVICKYSTATNCCISFHNFSLATVRHNIIYTIFVIISLFLRHIKKRWDNIVYFLFLSWACMNAFYFILYHYFWWLSTTDGSTLLFLFLSWGFINTFYLEFQLLMYQFMLEVWQFIKKKPRLYLLQKINWLNMWRSSN